MSSVYGLDHLLIIFGLNHVTRDQAWVSRTNQGDVKRADVGLVKIHHHTLSCRPRRAQRNWYQKSVHCWKRKVDCRHICWKWITTCYKWCFYAS